jgi:4'-phosphopantetheinyl transferase
MLFYAIFIKNVSDALEEKALLLLSSSQQQRVAQLRFPQDRQRRLIGILIAKYCIQKSLGLSWKNIEFCFNNHGKPMLKPVDSETSILDFNFDFNISHDGNWIICAMETERNTLIDQVHVGCDVSCIKTFTSPLPIFHCELTNDISRISNDAELQEKLNISNDAELQEMNLDQLFQEFKDYFTDNEWKYIKEMTGLELKRVHELWALKESFVKAIGIGMQLEFKRIEFVKMNSDWRE